MNAVSKFTALLLFLLVSGIGYSQHSNSLRYKVRLRSQENVDRLSKTSEGNHLRIIVKTEDSLSLGYVPIKEGNETIGLATDLDRPSEWLEAYALKRFTGKNDKLLAAASFMWVIRTLSLSSDTGSSKVFTHLAVDIYGRKAADKDYSRVIKLDTLLERPNVDSLSYGDALADALDALYAVSGQTVGRIGQSNKSVLMLESSNSDKPNANPRILSDSVYVKGIYRNYQEFLDNAPSIKGAIWAKPDTASGNGAAILYRMGDDSSAIEVNDAWGVCFGGFEVYKLEQRQLIPIEKSGSGFILSRYQDYTVRKNNAFAWRLAMSSAWPNDTNPYERKRSIPLGKLNGRNLPKGGSPVATRLDIATGELSF